MRAGWVARDGSRVKLKHLRKRGRPPRLYTTPAFIQAFIDEYISHDQAVVDGSSVPLSVPNAADAAEARLRALGVAE